MKASHFISAVRVARYPRSMWNMLRAMMKGQYRPSVRTIVYFFLLMAYIVFPLDVLPDFIPFIGWVDDGMLLVLFLGRLNREAELYTRELDQAAILTVSE